MPDHTARSIEGTLVAALSRWRFLRSLRNRFGALLLSLLGLILLAPLCVARFDVAWPVSLLGGAVLLAGLQAARPGRPALAVGLTLALADFTLGRLALASECRGLLVAQSILWLVTLSYVGATILEAIFETRRVESGTLQAALCVYVLLGLFGAFAYALIELLTPGSFTLAEGGRISGNRGSIVPTFMRMYSFGFATLSGAGSAGVSPATTFATNAVSLKAMVGQVYLAVVVARLVARSAGEDEAS